MHIDYIAVSFPKVTINSLDEAADFASELYGERWTRYLNEAPREFRQRPALAPFNACLSSPLGDIHYKRGKNGVSVQIAGKACQRFDWDWLTWICAQYKITRLDIAHDIYDASAQLTPALIVANHTARTVSEAHSVTGDTYYLGSPKSDTMTRVYMYAPPNPRAGVPRVEHQFRRAHAQAAAAAIAKGQMYDLYETRNRALNLSPRASASIGYETVKISGPARTDDDSKKVAWVMRSVRPVLNRLIQEGAITVQELFDRDTLARIGLLSTMLD